MPAPSCKRSTGAIDDVQLCIFIWQQSLQLFPIEEILQPPGEARSPEWIITAEERLNHPLDLIDRTKRLIDIDPASLYFKRPQRSIEFIAEHLPQHSSIAIDDDTSFACKP